MFQKLPPSFTQVAGQASMGWAFERELEEEKIPITALGFEQQNPGAWSRDEDCITTIHASPSVTKGSFAMKCKQISSLNGWGN